MKSLFAPERITELATRVSALSPDAKAEWGRMSVTQMLAHCSIGLESAVGEREIKRVFIGYIFGPIARKFMFRDDEPMKRNAPTAREFIVTRHDTFDVEQRKLIALIERFGKGGAAGCTRVPHSFFGKLTPEQWAVLMYKHVDHHLRQFGG